MKIDQLYKKKRMPKVVMHNVKGTLLMQHESLSTSSTNERAGFWHPTVCRRQRISWRQFIAAGLIVSAAACTTQADFVPENGTDESTSQSESAPKPQKLPVACKQPAPVKDIWALEPILVKSGAITTSMTKEEKERELRAYIARRNKQYEICLRGKKG